MRLIERIAVLETKIDFIQKMIYAVLFMLAAQLGLNIDVSKVLTTFGIN